MPLNPMNFIHTPNTPDWSNLSNLFGNVQKGYETAAAPHKTAQEYIQRILQNKLMNLQTMQAQQQINKHNFIWGGADSPMGNSNNNATPSANSSGILNGAINNGTDLSKILPGSQGAPNTTQPNIAGFTPDRLRQGAIAQEYGLGVPTLSALPGGESAIYNPKTGGYDVKQLGSRPGEVELEKGLATANVEAIKQNNSDYSKAAGQKHSMQGMIKLLEDPNLQKSVGPFWKNSAAKYFGSDQAKEAQAQFNTFGKTIITETSRAFGSQTTNQEMKWLEDVLPKDSDTLPALRGKLQTLEMLREAIEQKAIIKDQLMRKGMTPIVADQLAASAVDLTAIKKAIKPTLSFKGPTGAIEDVPKTDTAYIERLKAAGYEEGEF